MLPIKRVEARTVHQELQDRITEYILANKLRPGDPLPTEAQLAEQLGVSRSVLREGLRALESRGVIYTRRGEGRFVSGFQIEPLIDSFAYSTLFEADQITEILEVRERLEVGFVPDAVAALDQADLERLRTIVAEMYRKQAAGELTWREDLEFHRLVYQPIGNRVVLKLLDVFWQIFRNLRDRSLIPPRDAAANIHNHAAILEAIEARDVELAQRRIAAHFDDLRERLRDAQLTHSDGVNYLKPAGEPGPAQQPIGEPATRS